MWKSIFKTRINAKPQGQARPRVFFKSGRVWAFSKKNDFYNACKNEFIKQFFKIKRTITSPVFIKSSLHFKTKEKGFYMHKPDIDNILKAIMDALVESNIISDDNLICKTEVEKLCDAESFAEIEILIND